MSRDFNFDTSSDDAYYSYDYDYDDSVVIGFGDYEDYRSTDDYYNFNYANYKLYFLLAIYEVLDVTFIKALVEFVQVHVFILWFWN